MFCVFIVIYNKLFGELKLRKNIYKFILWVLFIIIAFLIWPGKVILPGSIVVGEKPYSEGQEGRWQLIETGTELEYQFEAASDRLKGITLNIQKQNNAASVEKKQGNIIVAIKDSYDKEISIVYQAISQLQENSLTFFELDAHLNKGDRYSLNIYLDNGSEEQLCIFEKVEKDSFIAGIQFKYLKSLESASIILIWVGCILLGVLLLYIERIPNFVKFIKIFIFLLVLAIIGAWWYFYKFKEILDESIILNRLYMIILCLLALIFIIQLFICYWKKEKKPQKLFLYSSVMWGVIYLLIFPAFTAPDEDTHFVSSYDLANVMMGMDELGEDGKVLMRNIDNQMYELSPGRELMEKFYSSINIKTEKWSYVESISRNPYSTSRQTSIFNYLFQAIGVAIARVLNLNYFWVIILGRASNLLAYIILTYLAIKIIPIGKWLIYVISQFPMVLELSASYSYDVINIGMVFLFIALILNVKFNDRTIKVYDLVIISIVGVVMTMIKGMYFPILFAIFMIPKEKFSDGYIRKKSVLLRTMVVLFIVVISFLVNNQMLMHISGTKNTVSTIAGHSNARSIYTLLFDPFEIIKLFGNTIIKYGDSILFSIFGQKLAWRIDMLPLHLIVCFIGIAIYALDVNDNMYKSINLSDRIISLLIMFACTGLATMAMLLVNTPVGSETIEGVQGRYLVPFLPLLSITAAYNNSKTLETSSKATRIVIGTSILNYISVLYIFTYILSN